MSTLSGVPTKGEKGKKFQSLDINSLYHTNRGESSDHHSQKNIVRANRHGMQPLGKVPSRRPPANLPSLKSEHSGNDPTVSLVPTGGTGWGSKPGETGPSPSSLQPNSQTAPTQTNLISQPHGTNAPAAAGNSAQPSNLSTQASTTQPPVTLKPAGSALSTGDKTWSSVTGGADQGPSFLAHQSPQFQQEFPSLSGEGAGQGLLRGAVASTDSSYGPGPSLRPQSEGSWILGGSTRSSTPQHPYFPQESGGIRNNLGQYGVGGGQGGLSISPPHSQISSMPFKPMTPFLVQHKTGSSSFPSGFPGMNPTRSSNSGPSENRFSSGGNRPPVGEEVDPIPIVKVEDINRIDEISRDTGWANQNVIDYNETLQFSDNESNGPDEVKEKTTKSTSPQKNYEKETDHEKHNEKSHQSDKPWNLRNTSLPHDYHPMRPTEPMTRHELEMDSEMQAKRNLKEKIAVFADKAHQRKEEEEQRFNHKKTMQENELKNKKDDYYTEKDEKPTKTLNKESDFRQTSQMDSRQNYNDRGEVRNSSYSVPPRFLKQRNEKNNQYMRQQPNDYFPNYNSEESRWQNHYKNRNDEDRDKDRMKDKDDDKEREQERERYNRGIRNDRGNEPSRKNYFENHGQDYRSQRNFEDRKEAEYRQREKEVEWEGRHGNSSFQDRHHPDDKNKRRNDGYSNKGHSSFVEDRESDVRDRPQRPESRDRPEHPSRPDSRDSRVSRESRNSRESTRDDPHSFSELSHNYSWDEKPRKKDYKEERENQTKREGFGPIKSEKFTAYNEKKEKSSTSLILTRNSMEDSRNKTGNVATSINSWGDPNENSQAQKASTPPTEQPSQQSDDQEIKDSDKKKDSGPIKENKNLRGTSNRGRGARQGGNLSGNNYSNFPSRGNWPRDNRKVNKPQKGQWNGSESEQSADDVSASTESGKEDKKVIERKQRSSRSGDRKKEKDERNRESKKSDDKNTHNRLDKKMLAPQQAPIGSGSNYDSNRRKEGFLPIGEPSKRGRGGTGFRMSRGGGAIGNVSGLYGPPGTKTPFPSHQHSENKNDDDKSNDKNHENDSQDEKAKHKSGASGITGFPRQNKDSRKDDGKNQKNKNKGKGNGEDWDTLSDESVDKNRFKHPGKGERKPQSRPVGDKTRGGPSNAMQINGRPSRSDEGKGEDQNVGEKKQALLDKDSDSFPNNGFQEVRNKKVGKEVRPMSKEDQKPRGNKESKGKPLGGPNSVNKTLPQTNKQPHQKREWSSNKPPRMQRLENSRQQQQQDVNDMNKMNQNVPLFSLPREVKCTAAPPPPTNAWDKPIVLNQSVSPPNSVHLSNVNSDKSGLEINDHQGGSQTGSPTADKALNKMSRDTVDKNMRHTVQTIIIQNTNYKAQSLDKPKGKLDEDIDQNHQMRLVSGYKDMKSNEKSQESLQMPMTFIKNEDNADMDFKFDSELSQLTEDKTTNIPHSILAQSSSAADLNQKIASVKKVWDAPGSVMEHPHHDENLGVVSTASSTFAANFSGVVDTSLDHSSVHQVDDSAFNNTDVYGTAPMQAAAGGYSNSANIMKQDAINPGSTPQPQQAVAIASGLNHSANLSSPPPQYNQTTHFNSYQQYSGIPAVPSPPTMISLGGGQPNDVFPFMMGNQATRTNFNQYTFGLNPPNVMSQTSGFGQQSALYHIPQAAGTNGPLPNDPFSQFRVTAPYAQSPQIPNNPTTVLITSSTANSSLMSASVKSSTQLGAIGSKAYQSPHPVVGYMPYGEPQMITQSYMRGTVPTMGTTPTSFYNSTVGQTPGIFQAQGSSLLTQAGNQTALPATYGFNTQSGNNSSSNVNQTSYNSQPGHFRGQTAGYLKPPVQTVQHPNDPSKLVSSNQDVLNSVFSGGGSTGQIPSPKSRTSGGNTNKPPPQQPSPTQTHQKFLNYPNQNLLQQGNAGQRANQASMYMRTQNNTSMLGNNNMGKIYNQPIQRPNFPSQMNSNQQNQLMQQQQQNRHQQRIPNSRQPTQQPQPHNKLISHHYFHQPGNSGKIEPGNIDAKVDTEKLQETNNAPKQDKKEETTSAEQ